MRSEMDQEKSLRFEHITVGGAPTEVIPQLEEEEIITIGAVNGGVSEIEIDDIASRGSCDDQEMQDATSVRELSQSRKATNTGDAGPEDFYDEEDLGEAMPLVQRIVLICCGIGLVIAAAFLIWFWLTQR